MAELLSIINTRGQSVDTLWGADGISRIKLSVGNKDVGLTPDAGWQGVASHEDEDTFVASDGVVVGAGVEGSTVRKFAVDSSGRQEIVVNPSSSGLTDISNTITVGGTSQELAAVKLDRKYLLVVNIDEAEDLWINFTSDATEDSPSVPISPRGAFVMEGSFVTSEKVTVVATTTGHKFTAKEA